MELDIFSVITVNRNEFSYKDLTFKQHLKKTGAVCVNRACVCSRQNQLKDQQHQQQPQVVSLCQLPDEAECLTVPRYKRDLVQKLKILRQELSQQQPQAGHCRIEVSREEIFEVICKF